MAHYHFDCLIDGVLHPDAFGVDLRSEDVPLQARAVLSGLVEELIYDRLSLSVSVDVRGSRGGSVYAVRCVIDGAPVDGVAFDGVEGSE